MKLLLYIFLGRPLDCSQEPQKPSQGALEVLVSHFVNFWVMKCHIPVKHHRGAIRFLEGNWHQQLGIISTLRYEALTDDVNDFFRERHL